MKDVEKELVARSPLVRFSIYTVAQIDALAVLATEIGGDLDAAWLDRNVVDAEGMRRAYGRIWLWVLGAYEVTRTMARALPCFSVALGERLVDWNRKLAVLRMPFAKQECQGDGGVIGSEASVAGLDSDRHDLLFEVQGKVIAVRAQIVEWHSTMGAITPDDVLMDLRVAHPARRKR